MSPLRGWTIGFPEGTVVIGTDNAAPNDIAIIDSAFLTRNEHLLVYSADTGEHQPAFICVHNWGGGQTHRIAWHSEEIGAIAPDASTTMFMTFNRIGQVAVWDISDASVTDNEDHSSPNNRTNP